MEQFAFGNTMSKLKGKKSRCWAFTYNNPPNGTVNQLIFGFTELGCEYVFQREKGSTVHLQGAIYFKNPRVMAFQKIFSEKIHWEFGKNWRNLKKYCCKVDTRIEGPWTNINGLKFRETIKNPLDNLELYPWQEKTIYGY